MNTNEADGKAWLDTQDRLIDLALTGQAAMLLEIKSLRSRLAASEERARKAEELAAKVALYVGLHVEDPGDFDSIIEYAAMYDETEAYHALPAVRRHLDQSESYTETAKGSKDSTP